MSTLSNAHALVAGIANYRHVRPLPETVLQDAQDFHDVLVDPSHCAYPDHGAHVQLLLDGEATAAALRQALADLAERTNEDSTVTIYLSCHGGRIPAGPQAGEYLLPVDVRHDPADLAVLRQTAISGDAFSQALRTIPARKLLVLIDCCHAGGIGQPKDALTPDPNEALAKGFSEAMYEKLKEGYGRVIIASARPDEESYVLRGDRNSLFTKHLLAGLTGGVSGEDGFVRVFQLYEYVQPRVTAEHPRQHPRFKSDMEENFPVGLYLGGQKAVAPAPPPGEDRFRYDVYVSYVDEEPDAGYVWDELIPQIEASGLPPDRIAVSGEVNRPGVSLVLEVERALAQSKRVLLVMSQRYLQDRWASFEHEMTQHLQIEEGSFRLLPVIIDQNLPEGSIPLRLRHLGPVDLTDQRRGRYRLRRVLAALQEPLPTRSD